MPVFICSVFFFLKQPNNKAVLFKQTLLRENFLLGRLNPQGGAKNARPKWCKDSGHAFFLKKAPNILTPRYYRALTTQIAMEKCLGLGDYLGGK